MIAVGNGMTSKEIASSLGLSPRTIHAYLENIYWKLGVSGQDARRKAFDVATSKNMLT